MNKKKNMDLFGEYMHRFDSLGSYFHDIFSIGKEFDGFLKHKGRTYEENLADGGKALFIELELPGFSASQISVKAFGEELKVSALASKDQNRNDIKYALHLKETDSLDFERMTASVKDGLLTVAIPKKLAVPKAYQAKVVEG